ncbi:FAD-dependent urate hydroxylase [Daldinia childiae]|uniref:FAD-dependent urate hydroxylase n=1 Tax=Daldinia childiae TaxID=326645 RepID=UPI0014481F48|nr:FAD-dependent urate hydroxylase [Daldinia childiae]KAF3070990.1 FAD-dependent urate hydroxylase [Daldinia childiae]
MKPDREFKVIIAGGGIAGLTLANMLEKFGLNYTLLESHSEIAPQVGASIGLFPNGLRILDQIGCYEQILEVFEGEDLYKRSYLRDRNGKALSILYNMRGHFERRHSYGLLFFDRQRLLQILYDHLENKDQVLLNKKFATASLTDEGVRVTCADGSVYDGTLLVGADGVHSAVRSTMIALGNKIRPGSFDLKEQDGIPCYYRCSFGIAQHVPGWIKGEQHIVLGRRQSQLVVSGPEDRVYWFLFDKLPEIKYGKDIPNYTKEDEADFIKHNFNVHITEKVTLGQVYSKRLSSTLTPLHEFVYKKWFFDRIVILGDSVHKPNPIGGQGANGAIESCAELINALLRKRDDRGGTLDGLSNRETEQIFQETQNSRQQRAQMVVDLSHQHQALNAHENSLLSSLIFSCLVPLTGKEGQLSRNVHVYTDAAMVKALPVPERARAIPYRDELPAIPLSKNSFFVRGALVGAMSLALLVTTKAWRLPFTAIEDWVANAPIVIRWFGENNMSKALNMYVSVLAIPMLDRDPSTRLHLVNFLSQLISPLLVYCVEGYRVGNQVTPLALPSAYSVGMQLLGIGRISPAHTILSSFFTHELPTGRSIPVSVAKSLIPAVTLGFVIPTIFVFVPVPSMKGWQNLLALWQFAPPLFNILTNVFSAGLERWQRGNKSVAEYEEEHKYDCYEKKDVPILKSVYTYAFTVQATAHIATLSYAWMHPGISIAKTFFGLPNPFSSSWNLPDVFAEVATFFRYDMAVAVASFLSGNLYSIWDLRRLGYIKTTEAIKAGLAVVAGQFLVGPGATWAGLWYWREEKLANLDTQKKGESQK